MKYLGTLGWCSLYGNVKAVVDKELGITDSYHNTNYRLVCKCRGLRNGNEITSKVAPNAFRYDFCSETGNAKELKYFENPDVTFIITCERSNDYITDLRLKELGVI